VAALDTSDVVVDTPQFDLPRIMALAGIPHPMSRAVDYRSK
jgi:hypothetical protein